MAGPWEKYGGGGASAAPAGPWAKYAQPAAQKPQPPQEGDPAVFKSGPATQQAPVTIEGLGKQFATDATKAAIRVAATPGDAREGLASVSRWAAEKLGVTPEVGDLIANAVRGGFLVIPGGMGPTSSEVTDKLNEVSAPTPTLKQVVTGEKPKGILEREPQNTEEAYAGAVGDFIPGVIGPGGPVRKAAQVLVPAVASETAGQATKGSEYESLVRAVFGLAGGVATAGRGTNITKLAAKGAPERAAVKAEADALYDKLRSAGIRYDSNTYDRMAIDLATKMKAEGFRPATSAKVKDSLEYVLEGTGKSPDFNDFEAMRKNAGGLLASADKEERRFGSMIVEALDNFAERSPLITSGNVPSNAVAPLMKEARALAQRNIKARTLEEAIERARNTASGFENGLRIEFRKILNNPKRRAGYTGTELAVLKEITRGTTPQNLAAQFGRLGIGLGTKTAKAAALPALVGGGGAFIDPIIAGSTVAAASGVKYLAARNAEKLADRAVKTVLSGKEAQRAALQAKRGEQLRIRLRQLLALDNVTRDARTSLTAQPVPQK